MTAQLPQDAMDLIVDMLDCELIPQVYVLESPDQPWRPVLRDDPYEPPCLVPGGDDVWDIL